MFNWSGGYLSGACTIPNGATLTFSGAADKLFSFLTLTNNGRIVWTGSGSLNATYNSVLQNNGTFSIQGDARFSNYTGGSPVPAFNNNGLLQKTNSAGTTVFSADNGGWIFNNNGTRFDIASGVFSIQNPFYVNAGSTFTGAGVTRVDASTVFFNGTNILQSGATFELAGGTVIGTNTFTGAGTFGWTGGTFNAIFNLQSNIAFNISGANNKTFSALAAINTAGTATWTGAGIVYMGYGSVLNNSGSFTTKSDSMFYNNTGGSPLPLFNNTGSFTKTNGAGTTAFDPSNGGVAFNNNGSVNVQSGVLTLGGGGADQNATFAIASASRMDLNGGAHTFGQQLNFNGTGLTRLTAGALTFSNGTNTFNNGGAFELAAGTVSGTNTFAGTGAFNWTGGNIAAILNLQPNIALNISGAADKTFAPFGTINTAGIGMWTGAGTVYAGYGSVLNNTGSFTVQNDSPFYNNTGGSPLPLFINNGSFTKTNSTGITTFKSDNGGVAFNNNGTVNIQSGTLALGGGGTSVNETFATAAGSLVDFFAGGFFFNGSATLAGAGTNRISGASATFNIGTNILGGGTFEVASGLVAGTNTFAGVGKFNWTGGTISAVITLQSNIGLNISGAADKTFAPFGTINSAGIGTWTGVGIVYAGYGSVLNNTGSFTVQNDSMYYNNTGGSPVPVFINNGSFTKTNSAGVTTFRSNNNGVAFNNNGTINVQAGDLLLGGGGTGTNGIFTVASGSHIDLTALNFALWGNLVFNGAGVTRANAGGVAFGGGTNTINGTFEISGGTVSGVGTFNGPGTFNWTAGTIAAVFNLRSNLTFNLPVGEVTLAPFGTLNNAGTMTWSGSGNINMGYGSAINNSGTFTVQNDGAFFNNTGGAPTPVVNNSGTFRKNTATGVTTFHPSNGGVNFTNTGTADLQTGNVLIWAGYATSPSARLQIPIGGMTANTQFGTETFNTPATFDGTLAISLVNGFTPTNGQSFTLVSYGSRTGQFATTQFPPLPVQSKWNLVYTPNSVLLQVVPSAYFQTFSLTNGAFRFSFTGQTGSLCLIEASTNLFNWNPLLTNTPFAGSLNFVDPQTTQFSKRFYRATIFP